MWDTSTDSFVSGQWFHGRLYERRCDLSPDGSKLIYFASKLNRKTLDYSEYTYAWTAISKPPFLTALALWPIGDCWHGGGLFENNRTVWLNHKPEVAKPHIQHRPRGLKIIPNPQAHGEDGPVYSRRLLRDGWLLKQEGSFPYTNRGWKTERPEIWHKLNKANGTTLVAESESPAERDAVLGRRPVRDTTNPEEFWLRAFSRVVVRKHCQKIHSLKAAQLATEPQPNSITLGLCFTAPT